MTNPATILQYLATLALGSAGGLLALQVNIPLALMIGSLLAVALVGASRLRPFGRAPALPPQLRSIALPVIGVAIGASFTPAVLTGARHWWPSLLALCVFIPAAHLAGYALLRRIAPFDKATAFFGTAPGGLIETVLMGEERGADVPMLTMLQFLRLVLTIIVVPVAFTVMSGHAVGTASGAVLGDAARALTRTDMGVLTGAGVAGAVIGHRLRMPAGLIFGPIVLSAVAHLAGWVQGAPPGWLVGATQVVVGSTLGTRFVGMRPRIFLTALRYAVLTTGLTMMLAWICALVLPGVVGESPQAVFLAFAPGGLTEMSLIALSLNLSVVYVSLHHVARILLAVGFARVGARWLI